MGCSIVGGLGVLAALVVAAGLVYLKAADQIVVSDADREALITMAVMDEWFEGWEYTPALEGWDKIRYPDGTWELGYEYDSPAGEEAIYLQCSLSDEGKPQDAKFGYSTLETGTRASLNVFGGDDIKIVERPDLLSWGDRSACWIIESEVGPVGNFFIARKGSRIVHYYCIGVYFDDPELFADFLAPMLDAADGHVFEGEPVEP